jgi:diguanylate cyclase (GGDEF)-like protein
MSDDPVSENRKLRSLLQELMAHARENEQVLRRFQELELRLISAGGFRDLFLEIFHSHRQSFGLDALTLALCDPEYEIRRMLDELGIELSGFPGLVFFDSAAELARPCGLSFSPVLGLYDPACHAHLFPGGAEPLASVALLPLARRGRLIGSLNLGSLSEARFTPGMATDFLDRLAAVVSISLENVTNSERLKYIGLTDPLTGVHNRRYFDERLLEEVSRAQRQGHVLSCLFLDVDHFKRINDTHGHQVGDWVLREIAARIKSQMRFSDVLGRYGGEEFAVLLVQTDKAYALSIAERIRRSVADVPFLLTDENPLSVTLSVGVAALRDCARAEGAESLARHLVARADQALYRAKRAGRNRVLAAGGEEAGTAFPPAPAAG